MKARCCRSLPRCADCPVLVAARTRRFARDPTAKVFASVRTAPPREMPLCVLQALAVLDERRFTRDGGD